MSYDMNIWSKNKLEVEANNISIGDYVLFIDESVNVEVEDIPVDVFLLSLFLPDIIIL